MTTRCEDHDVTAPCHLCAADHLAAEHAPGSHPDTCPRCAVPTIPQAQLDAASLAAGDKTLTDTEENR